MDDDDMEEETEYKGSFEFDVLNGTSAPFIEPIDLKPGVYHELKFHIDNVLPSGNSIKMFGVYNDGTSDFEFEYTTTMDEEFEIENKEGIDLILN